MNPCKIVRKDNTVFIRGEFSPFSLALLWHHFFALQPIEPGYYRAQMRIETIFMTTRQIKTLFLTGQILGQKCPTAADGIWDFTHFREALYRAWFEEYRGHPDLNIAKMVFELDYLDTINS